MAIITSKEIRPLLHAVEDSSFTRMLSKEIPGRVSSANKIIEFDKDIFYKWYRDKCPTFLKRYNRRRHTKFTHYDLEQIFLKHMGMKITGKTIAKHMYKKLDKKEVGYQDIIDWFDTEECERMIKVCSEKIDPVFANITKTYKRNCGEEMEHRVYQEGKQEARCSKYLTCKHYIECLDFFDNLNWRGWGEK
jgi:hypothetical protein